MKKPDPKPEMEQVTFYKGDFGCVLVQDTPEVRRKVRRYLAALKLRWALWRAWKKLEDQ